MEYKFSKPYEFEGTKYESIELDLDKLSGEDMDEIQVQLTAEGYIMAVPAADTKLCAMLAARAAKKPFEFIKKLPVKDYLKITQEISIFLLN